MARQVCATHEVVGFGEYLCLRLFGGNAAGVSLASATGLFNQRACDWDWDFIRALELSPDTLPQIEDENRPQLTPTSARRWPALADGADSQSCLATERRTISARDCSTRETSR
jgi:glycerol kinase